MKNFKKLALVLAGLILVFSMVACTTDKDKDGPAKDIIETPEDDIVEDLTDDPMEEDIPEDDNMTEGMDENMDSMDAMIQSSDYISKIQVMSTGPDNTDIQVLDNIKKELSPESIPELSQLEDGKTYLVFMKDEGDTLVLADETEGVILLEGENKDLFEQIDQQVNNQ